MSLPGTSRRCMRAAGAAVNCIARIAGITSIIRIEINVRANLGKRRARHRSPGALTCAKLGRFVHWMAPLHRACADWPRTSARGFFRGDYSPALANRIRQARISLGPRYRPLCGAGFMDGIDPWPRTSARGLFCPGGHTDTICSRPALWGQRGNPVETTLAARQLGLKQDGPWGV